jgi:hypothetical protein
VLAVSAPATAFAAPRRRGSSRSRGVVIAVLLLGAVLWIGVVAATMRDCGTDPTPAAAPVPAVLGPTDSPAQDDATPHRRPSTDDDDREDEREAEKKSRKELEREAKKRRKELEREAKKRRKRDKNDD